MQSSIKIDFQDSGFGLQPVIAIKLVSSDDVRDGLLKTFFQALGGESSWLSVRFDHNVGHDEGEAGYSKTWISIHPITPDELPRTIKLINSRLGKVEGQPATKNLNPITRSKGYDLTEKK